MPKIGKVVQAFAWTSRRKEKKGMRRACYIIEITNGLCNIYPQKTVYYICRFFYDCVPRQALMRILRRLGCGYLMVTALSYLYSDTRMILGSAVVAATIGLRQGTPTSCLLFTIFLDEFVRDMKMLRNDGFLKWIHCFSLMDDTGDIIYMSRKSYRKSESSY